MREVYESMQPSTGGDEAHGLQAAVQKGKEALQQLETAENAVNSAKANMERALRDVQGIVNTTKASFDQEVKLYVDSLTAPPI